MSAQMNTVPRLSLAISANGYARFNKPVTVDAGEALRAAQSLHVVEVDAKGDVIDAAVSFQFDAPSELTLLLKGATSPDATRHYHVYSQDSLRSVSGRAGRGAMGAFSGAACTRIRIMHRWENGGNASFRCPESFTFCRDFCQRAGPAGRLSRRPASSGRSGSECPA